RTSTQLSDSTALDSVSSSLILSPPRATLFPYTTLFRSLRAMNPMQFEFLLSNICEICRNSILPDIWTTCVRSWVLRVNQTKLDRDRKSTRLNSSHLGISYAVFCLKKKKDHLTAGM